MPMRLSSLPVTSGLSLMTAVTPQRTSITSGQVLAQPIMFFISSSASAGEARSLVAQNMSVANSLSPMP